MKSRNAAWHRQEHPSASVAVVAGPEELCLIRTGPAALQAWQSIRSCCAWLDVKRASLSRALLGFNLCQFYQLGVKPAFFFDEPLELRR
jgi:hypothetical protein